MSVLQENKQKLVESELLWDNRVASIEITVTVEDSTAVLRGTVASSHEKRAAEEAALGVPGINYVENKIEISFPSETNFRPDAEIKAAIENILREDSRINAENIKIEVDSGRVTLSGSIDAFWKITVVENLAYSVRGVVSVANKFDVSWKDEHSDEKIADEIKNALERSNAIDARDVIVEVNKGKVTLRGQAPNIVGKNSASEKAAYTAGVVGVDNQIEVA